MNIDEVLKDLEAADSDIDWADSDDDGDSDLDDCDGEPTDDALSLAQVSVLNPMDILQSQELDTTFTPASQHDNNPLVTDTQISNTGSVHQPETPPTHQANNSLPHTAQQTQATSTCTSTNAAGMSPPPFTEHIGPRTFLPSDSTPLEFFNLIFGEDTYKLVADQTNLYAQQNPPPPSLHWTSVCEDEMKLFMGITMIMGVHKLPEMEDYWSGDALLGVPGIVAGMSFKRFKAIRHCLHLNDNTTAAKRGEPGFDRMHKVRPLMDLVNTNTKNAYHPHREISIDEAMVGFKGRNRMKQYMPMKPTKRGFKMWNGCDAHNGLTLVHQPYTGSVQGQTQGGPSIVKSVASSLMDENHFLFYNNYFSTVELASELADRSTFSIATTRADRRGWPQELKNVKTLNKTMQRGEHQSVVKCGVECLVWKDKKAVAFINTICDPSSTTTVNRRNKDGSSSTVTCPELVKMYNKYMGGVDLADMKRKLYSCSRRSKKWWFRLFYYLVDISVVNSHVIISETPNVAAISSKNFVIEVARELMSSYSSRKRSPNTSASVPPSICYCERHFPAKCEKTGQCLICGLSGERKRTIFGCKDCSKDFIHLCPVPCFKVFHTKAK